MLKTDTAVDATFIAAPSSTKNAGGERDLEVHSTQKGGNWYFGMKAHIGVDADSGLVHTVIGTAANVHDTVPAAALLHGEECDVFADAGYQGADKRSQRHGIRWHVAMRPGKRRRLDTSLGRKKYPGRLPVENRAALNGILFVLKTGIRWRDLSIHLGFGSGSTCWRRLRRLAEGGRMEPTARAWRFFRRAK